MTGLLQRLAARATGNAWTLRSDARLPFAALPAVPDAQGPTLPTAPPSRRGAQAGDGGHAELQQTLARPAEDASHPAPPGAVPATHTPAITASPAPLQTEGLALAPRQTPAAPDHGIAPQAAPAAAPRMVGAPEQESAEPPQPLWHPLAPRVAARPDPQPLLPAHGSQAGDMAAPAPHLGAAATMPHGRQAVGARPSSAPTPAEPTEVHVHIGRIEVTALTQAQPQSQAPLRRTQPMSLDAYLARRKESS